MITNNIGNIKLKRKSQGKYDVENILKMHKQGYTRFQIADHYEVSGSTICKIIRENRND